MNQINYVAPSTNPPMPTSTTIQPHHQTQDFYSIIQVLQSALLQRQMEFQEWLSNKFKINNPIAKMLIALMVLYPSKSSNYFLTILTKAMYLSRYMVLHSKAMINRKPPPTKVEIKIPYIFENNVNHLYSALDWYTKNNKAIISNTNTLILTLKDEIKDKVFDQTFSENYPSSTNNSVMYKKCEFFFNKEKELISIYTTNGEIKKESWTITLWSYFSTKDKLKDLCVFMSQEYALYKSKKVWKQLMYSHNETKWNSKEITKNRRTIDTVVLPEGNNNTIKDGLTHFSQTEEWHLERGVPYKKCYLFYGPPGTGKTSMIKAISYEFQRHIHYLSLSDIESDHHLNELMSKIDYQGTVVVLEDIDAMSKITQKRSLDNNPKEDKEDKVEDGEDKDDNKNDHNKIKKGLTLSGLLNAIDGLHDNHGMILVMTSNMPDKLDPALIREGRIDDKVYFGYATHEQIYHMFLNFYEGFDLTKERFAKIDFPNNLAPCKVENIMKKNWQNSTQAIKDLLDNTTNQLQTYKF